MYSIMEYKSCRIYQTLLLLNRCMYLFIGVKNKEILGYWEYLKNNKKNVL